MLEEYRIYFNESKYTNWYFNIIIKAKNLNRKKRRKGVGSFEPYFEEHHIVPKCIASDLANLRITPNNGVLLTSREHILCHWLLCKMAKNKKHKHQFEKGYYYICFNDNGGQNKRKPSIYQIALARRKASEVNLGKKYIKVVPYWFTDSKNLSIFNNTLIDQYVNQKMTQQQMANLYGVSVSAINSRLNSRGFKISRNTIIPDKAWLYDQYVVRQRSIYSLSKELKCSDTTVSDTLKKYGIPIRNRKEALIIRKKNETEISSYSSSQASS